MGSAAELIVAPATLPGAGARAIVRLAGDGLAAVLAALVDLRDGAWPPAGGPARMAHGTLAASGLGRDWGPLDVMVLVWPGPGGPIGGPLAEIQLPASAPLVDAVVAEACRLGARLARGGEFTLRAFLTGRLDLVQAEAVLGVVDARSPQELAAALDRMAGGTGAALGRARDELVDLLADIEAAIDFADETTPDAVPAAPPWPAMVRRLDACAATVAAVAAGLARRDAAASDLPRVVLVGRPNIGKSSLFNALVGEAAALVADEPGTTRDWLEARLEGDGRTFVLVDVAGVDDADAGADGPVDATASLAQAARGGAVAEAARADVLVVCRDVADAEPVVTASDRPVRIDVVTRCDRAAAPTVGTAIPTSARAAVGIERLRAAIVAAVAALPDRGPAATVRVAVAARAAITAIAEARAAVEAAARGAAVDESIVAASVREAADAIADATGATIDRDLLDRIFARHCIGK
jgi:tRNA modification GTPase